MNVANTAESEAALVGTARPKKVYHIAFVIEYTTGHVTFAKMLQKVVASDPSVQATWFLVKFETVGWPANMFPLSRNYTLRTSSWARRLLGSAKNFDVAFFHTQTLSLFCGPLMRHLPSVISTDATPKNLDEVAVGYHHPVGGRFVERAKRTLVAYTLKHATYLMPWSDWCARSLIEDYGVDPARVRLLRPGVDLAAWDAKSDVHGGPLRILFVGGDFERKGGGDLLAALELLSGDWECDIVTKTEVDASSHSGKVRVHRHLNPGDPELVALFAEADAFVLPTRGDANPWVSMEAMAAGLPVVSTAVGAIPEIVLHGETGIIIEPGDKKALAEALQRLADNPAERGRMGLAGRRRASEHFDMEGNGVKILELAKSAAERTAHA